MTTINPFPNPQAIYAQQHGTDLLPAPTGTVVPPDTIGVGYLWQYQNNTDYLTNGSSEGYAIVVYWDDNTSSYTPRSCGLLVIPTTLNHAPFLKWFPKDRMLNDVNIERTWVRLREVPLDFSNDYAVALWHGTKWAETARKAWESERSLDNLKTKLTEVAQEGVNDNDIDVDELNRILDDLGCETVETEREFEIEVQVTARYTVTITARTQDEAEEQATDSDYLPTRTSEFDTYDIELA